MASRDFTLELDEKDYQDMMTILKGMEEIDQRQAVQNALRRGMQVIIDQGKQNLAMRNKVVSGNLKKSFGIQVNKKGGYSLGGHKRPKGAHAHLVDRGTVERYTRKGYYRGSVSRGHPKKGTLYWTSAVQTKGEQALNTLCDAIVNSFDEIMKRKGR